MLSEQNPIATKDTKDKISSFVGDKSGNNILAKKPKPLKEVQKKRN